MCQGMAWFKRWDNALQLATQLKCLKRLFIGDADILRAANVVQPGMFGANAGIIQTG